MLGKQCVHRQNTTIFQHDICLTDDACDWNEFHLRAAPNAARGVDGPIYFVRSGQWIMGYAAAKFADEIWSEDALE